MRALESLKENLEKFANDSDAKAARATWDFAKGLYSGEEIAYRLAAKWLGEVLARLSPPDPEDEEGTQLEPEEVAVDAKGGNVG